ncbi:unnamed protein product [Staurois parvus]|uniref:Uncharacterized protein n=1 Tax=Staurois parvus TaxID=386267 RepID=A0ABN9AYW6_9NEOB|nr:unnamed protein product [Staurois parvus]
MPHISAHKRYLSVPTISAMPVTATYQYTSVPPNHSNQCRLSVPVSAVYQCRLSVPISAACQCHI